MDVIIVERRKRRGKRRGILFIMFLHKVHYTKW